MSKPRERAHLEYIGDPAVDRSLTDCPVCKEAFENPQILPCGHSLCLLCVPQNCQCPVCNAAFQPDRVIPNPALVHVVASLRIRCPQWGMGCPAILGIHQVDQHIHKECQWRTETCAQCHAGVALPLIGEHALIHGLVTRFAAGQTALGERTTGCEQQTRALEGHLTSVESALQQQLAQSEAATDQRLGGLEQRLAASEAALQERVAKAEATADARAREVSAAAMAAVARVETTSSREAAALHLLNDALSTRLDRAVAQLQTEAQARLEAVSKRFEAQIANLEEGHRRLEEAQRGIIGQLQQQVSSLKAQLEKARPRTDMPPCQASSALPCPALLTPGLAAADEAALRAQAAQQMEQAEAAAKKQVEEAQSQALEARAASERIQARLEDVLRASSGHLFPTTAIMTPAEASALSGFLAGRLRAGLTECPLVLRGSRDGFEATTFHRLCDRLRGTVVVVQTTTGNVFGGYASVAWNAVTNKYTPDPHAFLFSLRRARDPAGVPCKIPQNGIHPEQAVCCSMTYGPWWGCGHDLTLHHQCNANTSSYTRLAAYTLPLDGDRNFLNGGTSHFQVAELEIPSCVDLTPVDRPQSPNPHVDLSIPSEHPI
ncbi:hypothetical protein PAPYR_4171 [Paratrimastix pyriformis]|uniref:Uncharacterized protein n=1 Tax=Paratrimastix pyriformis TaxID=342808 RepID=A0ABQ8UKN8_9EUKA|nr:hypothetical protein PAPYR_4171 [Paratrimastix pyriformis]